MGDGAAAGLAGFEVGVGAACSGSVGAVSSTRAEDDGESLGGIAAGPHAATKTRTTARRRILMQRSVLTRQPSGPDLAVTPMKRYEIRGGVPMPPRGVKSAKRKRQYEHIKRSETARGRSNKTAERIAAATTNKTRAKKGETK